MSAQPPPPADRSALLRQAFAARQLRMRKASRDLSTFIETAATDDHGHPIRLAEVHRQWIDHVLYCWARGLKALILAPWGHGKCQPAGSLVQLAEGSRASIEKLDGLHFRVLAFDKAAMAYAPAWARCFTNGVHPVARYRLRSGRFVDLTTEHPLLLFGEGWKNAGSVRVGDRIGVARALPDMGTQAMRPGEAALLGFIVGDGTVVGRSVLYTSGSAELKSGVARLAMSLGFEPVPMSRNKETLTVRLNGARKWADAHGLKGCNSRTKQTPSAIWTAPAADVRAYLRAYFACDGTVTTLRGGCVELYSVNYNLLSDVQSLLLRFGVTARISCKLGRYKGERHESWRLTITGVEALRAFRERLGIDGEKGPRLAGIDLTRTSNGNVDTIPIAYRKMLKKSAHWHKERNGISLDQTTMSGTTRAIVKLAASAEDNAELLQWCSDDVAWDEVVAIEPLGDLPTWGIEVDRKHTYLSRDVITHNSSTLAVPLIAHTLGQRPGARVKVVTNDDDSATNRVRAARLLIESTTYQQVFPNAKRGGKWTDHQLFLEREGGAIDPSLHARGVLAKGIGGRIDLLIFDDIVDQLNAATAEQREKITRFAESTWLSRLEPDGNVLAIGTTWHIADTWHYFMQARGWGSLIQRVNLDCTGIDQEVIGVGDDYPGLLTA